jgi:hypothetical protein
VFAVNQPEDHLLDALVFAPIAGITVAAVEIADCFDIDDSAFKIRYYFFPDFLYQIPLL